MESQFKEYLLIDLIVRIDERKVQSMSSEHKDRYDWGLSNFIEEARTLG